MNYTEQVALWARENNFTTETWFTDNVPAAIDYAEQRAYTDLDVINLDVRDGSASTVALDPTFNLPTAVGTFQVVTGVNIITPAATAPDSGTRRPLTPVSAVVLDRTYGSQVAAGVPEVYVYQTQSTIAGQKNLRFGPWPDAAYRVEVIGKIQWTPLSASNPTTFLTNYYPALFNAAGMVFWTGVMKNYGAQADDPKMGLSWDGQYKTLLAACAPWEARKRMAGASWTPKQIEPTAQPQRG